MARGYFSDERRGHTLQATALVHEVQVRLLGSEALPGENRKQFFAFAAKAMRHLLVDHARTRGRQKRGGGARKVPLDEGLVVGDEPDVDLIALDEALERLSAMDERKGRVVELKYFAGLTGDQIAEVLDVSPATVDRDWEVARTWLFGELSKGES
jgi:RNA polymerase sigma factor (TIGR02999 family)